MIEDLFKYLLRSGRISKTFTVTFKDGETVLQQVQVTQGGTATYSGTVPAKDGNAFLGWALSEPSNQIVDSDDVTAYQQISNVTENITCWAVYSDKRIIHDSWEVISQRSTAGTASSYYNIGDLKRVHLQGTVGTLALNQDVYVYVLGINHNSTIEGNGITFGCFKDINDMTDIALVDSNYDSSKTDGTKAFNIIHWGSGNYGGWSACDLRYDILGSTDVAPTGYGSAPSASRAGKNPTSTCATSPVANTLMSCLPSDLRAKMKPVTKYTDNTGNSSNTAVNVTSTTDYLPLLSEYEVQGARLYANQYEKDEQEQYAYFASGNSKVKYKHNDKAVSCIWWGRSPYYRYTNYLCGVDTNGSASYSITNISRGVAPIFLV